jgi:MFS transporter, SP family, sugar:H+ symporter
MKKQVVVAAILALKFGHGGELTKGVSTVLVVAVCLFVVSYGWSWGPLGWLVPSELFPLEMRSAGQSVVVCVNLFWTAAVAQCFLAALCHLRWGVFVLFAALIVVMSIFVILLLPETKQVPIEEIWMLFDKHWYWKRIVRKDPKYQGNLHLQPPANAAGGVKPASDV